MIPVGPVCARATPVESRTWGRGAAGGPPLNSYPFTTPIGLSRATLAARLARWTTSTTTSASL